MTLEELKLRRLAGQHLSSPADAQTVLMDLCGLQAQFLSHALHGLSIRCDEVSTQGLVKSWTIRGTMHLFCQEDLPLFLHQGRRHFLRPVDTLESDSYLSAQRKAFFADLMTDAIGRGIDDRESLKIICARAGMTECEEKSLFDPWGGTIRALCESGRICHKVQEQKAYRLCPPFQPMAELPARLELARRYFTHFGPATLKDAAYFFGVTQAAVKSWLPHLPLEEMTLDGISYFFIPTPLPKLRPPRCLFLAGFDQLMLGYEKTRSLFLPGEHIRDIFTRSGMVRPAILVDGTVVGWWNLKNRRLKITLFSPADKPLISATANFLWPDLRAIEYEN